ncbi:MAG: NADPH-dependent F420 reductase [Calditrichaeota bacterium]|nr:NADPH-dependent F420 reductase [Calditrichota bacterium]MBT7616698.1 NADPH-dependent F420 reductase [Calditrichota bacterium]MBT7787812.1 NADPH-dependent F420 reductase [Calditrichota bacterium]
MKCAVVGGTGWQGAGVAVRIASAGHTAIIGSRIPARAESLAKKLPNLTGLDSELFQFSENAEAAKNAEIVFVTAPMNAHEQIVEHIRGSVKGKIVVDVTAPVDPENQIENLWPVEGSATQQAQRILEGEASVVGALKNIAALALLNYKKESPCDILIVGDDLASKHTVIGLLDEMNLTSYDVGSGEVCRTIEGLTSMLIYLNYAYHLRQPGLKVQEIDPGLDFIPDEDLFNYDS